MDAHSRPRAPSSAGDGVAGLTDPAHLSECAPFDADRNLAAVVLMLAPVPARLKEWAYAGFAIDLASALIAHLSVGDGPEAWGWAAAAGVLWGLSYFF